MIPAVPKIIVVQRQTNVADKPIPSRSVCARLLEPMEYLVEKGKIALQVIDEKELRLADTDFDWLVFSKHSSDLSVRLSAEAVKRGKRVVYDIDDFLPAFPGYSGGQSVSGKIANLKRHVEQATVVTVATEFLHERIEEYFQHVATLVPNGINVERHFRYKVHGARPKIIFTNADLLKVAHFKDGFFEVMNRFLASRPEVGFDVITDPNPELNRFVRWNNLGNVPWFEHKRVLASSGYTIGIVPLGAYEDPEALLFNSCKSPIKYLEYGALKIAGIYSRSPIYEKVIRHGETGLLVENTEQAWEEALTQLVEDEGLRARIADAAYEDVCLHHSVARTTAAWSAVFARNQ